MRLPLVLVRWFSNAESAKGAVLFTLGLVGASATALSLSWLSLPVTIVSAIGIAVAAAVLRGAYEVAEEDLARFGELEKRVAQLELDADRGTITISIDGVEIDREQVSHPRSGTVSRGNSDLIAATKGCRVQVGDKPVTLTFELVVPAMPNDHGPELTLELWLRTEPRSRLPIYGRETHVSLDAGDFAVLTLRGWIEKISLDEWKRYSDEVKVLRVRDFTGTYPSIDVPIPGKARLTLKERASELISAFPNS